MGLIVNGRMRFLGRFEGVFPQLPPPTPSFTASPTTGIVPLTVQFTNTTTTGTGVTYQWDFNGDGITDSTEVNPSYTYTTVGTYSVTLRAISTGGVTTATIANYITPYTIPPASIEGIAINSFPIGMIKADDNTFIGLSTNPFDIIMTNDNSDSFIGVNTNTFDIQMSYSNASDVFVGTLNEFSIGMSNY